MEYRSIPTTLGRAKLEQAALMGVPLQLTVVEFGDGGGAEYAPTGLETALRGKVYEAGPNMIFKAEEAETWVELQAVIPFDVGGWWLREYGVRDAAGDLIFIGNLPQSFKPQGSSGAIKDVAFELLFDIQNADSVTLKVDPAKVLATRKYVDDSVAAAATEATQAEAEAGTDGTRKMTPRRVWQAITKRFSTQTQAEAGTNDDTVMTPLKVAQSIAAKVLFAGTTEAQQGTDNTKVMTPLRVLQAIYARIATQAQVDAGADDTTIVTPKKLRFGFQAVLAPNGYIIFPTWLGGVILQWGAIGISGSNTNVSYLVAYPNGSAGAAIMRTSSGASAVEYAQVSTYTLTNFSVTGYVSVDTNNTPGGMTISWLSLGW